MYSYWLYAKIRLQSTWYYYILIRQVWISRDRHFARPISNISILAPKFRIFCKPSTPYHRKLSTDLVNLQKQISEDNCAFCTQIWKKKSDKNCDRESDSKMQNHCHDVVKFEISKTAKKITGKYLSNHLKKVSAKLA